MKNKNISKTVRRNISKGWRYYFEVKVTYERLGLDKNLFLVEKDIHKILGLEPSKLETGFVDHYSFYDTSNSQNGIPLTVNIEFQSERDFEYTQREWNKNKFYYEHTNGEFYTFEGSRGFVNPNFDIDDDNSEYWLNDENGECSRYSWELTKDMVRDNHLELLRKHAHSDEFKHDMFGNCNIDYSYEKGFFRTDKYNSLCEDLSELSEYTKTNYYEFTDTHVKICYAIRYKDYVEPIIKDFKKLVKKHKLKNWNSKLKSE